MALNTKNFATLVQEQVAAIQGRSNAILDFSIGSVMCALIEGNAGLTLWLQSLALRILARTRAATSSGADLDSFVADFGLTRLGAQSSVGQVTFNRFTAGAQAVIAIGTEVRTADGTQRFLVSLDTTNSAYNAGLGGYVIPVGVNTLSVPVSAVTPGSLGNVLAGTVTIISSALLYVDTVTNASAFTGGGDQEGDQPLRDRFKVFIASLSKATPLAIGYAITSNYLGIEYTLTENKNLDGSLRPGFFYVVVDDGTGSPPSTLITKVQKSIDLVRPATVLFAVYAPTVTTVNVQMLTTIATGYDGPTVKGQIGTALTNAIKAIPLGAGLPYTKLAQIAYEASAGVTNISGILLNNTAADIVANPNVSLQPGTITVN